MELIEKIELCDFVYDEKDYVNLMAAELNITYDHTLTKNNIFDKYKNTVIQRYGKPEKFPCLIFRKTNDFNKTEIEIIYKHDIMAELKQFKDIVKQYENILNKFKPKTSKKDTSFL